MKREGFPVRRFFPLVYNFNLFGHTDSGCVDTEDVLVICGSFCLPNSGSGICGLPPIRHYW